MNPGIKMLPDPRNISMEEFCAKSKMSTATAIMENYEIGHNLKTIQVKIPPALQKCHISANIYLLTPIKKLAICQKCGKNTKMTQIYVLCIPYDPHQRM